MSNIDTGGSVAIKGFNYQKATMILVLIKNFKKEKFLLTPEARDDFEVRYNNYCFLVQVKGTKGLTLNKLTNKSRGKQSVIKQQILNGNNNDIRKLFLWNLNESTKNDLILSDNNALVSPVLKFSQNQIETIVQKLALNSTQIERLNNHYIYITPFENNLSTALTYLKGEMVNEGLITDNKRADIIISELSLLIDAKSEIDINKVENPIMKSINGEYLQNIFTTVEQMNDFNNVLTKLNFNTIREKRIRNNKVRIPLLFQHIKDKIKSDIDIEKIIDMDTKDILDIIISDIKKITKNNIDDDQMWAIAIECYCELEG